MNSELALFLRRFFAAANGLLRQLVIINKCRLPLYYGYRKKKKKMKRNVVYCCVMHETKYIVDILCTVITSLLNNEINLHMKKCFFQTYTTAIFHFFEKLFYYYECKLQNFYKNTCVFIFLRSSGKQPPEVFYKKAVLKCFAIFTGKHLCWTLF